MKQIWKSIGSYFLLLLLVLAFSVCAFFYVASAFNLSPIEAIGLLGEAKWVW